MGEPNLRGGGEETGGRRAFRGDPPETGRERAVAALHVATRDLMEAETPEAIAEVVLDTARHILDFPITTVRLLDEDGRLAPVAATEGVRELHGELSRYEPGEGLTGHVYQQGTPAVYEDLQETGEIDPIMPEIRSAIAIPLGEHGVFSTGSTEPADFDRSDVRLAQILTANAETALDRLNRERLLRDRAREIEKQNERLEAFAGAVSHDLQNPLNVASGYLDLAAEECKSEHLAVVRDAHERMYDLIADVLVVVSLDRPAGNHETVSLREVVESAWSTVDTGSARLVVDGDLPAVEASGGHLRRLLENLFGNAVEHGLPSGRASPDDDPAVSVRVGVLDSGTGFFVEDDGPGIDPGERDRVFESGYSTAEGGTGLGLDIVASIADDYGWEVVAAGGRDGGARFEIAGIETVRDGDGEG